MKYIIKKNKFEKQIYSKELRKMFYILYDYYYKNFGLIEYTLNNSVLFWSIENEFEKSLD